MISGKFEDDTEDTIRSLYRESFCCDFANPKSAKCLHCEVLNSSS